ncbi:ATP-grasp domain-containing protein [Streptomyces sp. NPDC005423]|uniref:ATP-grasp domain-containing protein n=1 Tax=Streptomyces sp. NPDC005423 TaxID=3155343 RepID=UPI0033A0C810
MTEELLMIGAGFMGVSYAEAARRLGLRVRVVGTAQHAGQLGALADEMVLTDGGPDEVWAQAACAAAQDRRPDGVLAFSEPQVLAAALVQERHDLPGPSLYAATVSRNKALQRACFGALGLPQPLYLVTDDLAAARAWARAHLPVVVKPLAGSASYGVELVADEAAYEDTVRRRAGSGRLLVESFVPGPEYSWEGLLHDGHVLFGNVTAKQTSGAPQFVERGHRPAQRLPQPAADALQLLVPRLVDALGMRTGIVHLEFRLTEDGPSVMEVAVRTPGDYIPDVISMAYGFDLYEAVVLLAMGRPLRDVPQGPAGRASASWFPVAEAGTVLAVEGLAEVRAHPAVRRAAVWASPGDVVGPLSSSADRVGCVLLDGDDEHEVEEAARFVRERLRIVTRQK